MLCSACHHENPQTYKFCGACGSDLRPAAVTAVAPQRSATAPINLDAAAPYPDLNPAPPTTVFGALPGVDMDTTRYMCSAMHLDPKLADQVIGVTVDVERRAVASAPGVSLPTVIKHALVARRRHLLVDALLTAAIVLFFVVAVAAGAAALVVVILAWAVIFADLLYVQYSVLRPQLSRSTFQNHPPPEPTNARRARRLAEIADRERGNLHVYSGYLPFVGSGIPQGGWSFAVDVTKPAEGMGDPVPFEVKALKNAVASALRDLDWPTLRLEDKLIVSGLDIRDDARFLSSPHDPPRASVDPTLIDQLLDVPDNRARPYLRVQVTGWGGELTASIFLRFVKLPASLFVEASYLILTPVNRRFQEVDRLTPTPTLGQLLHIGGQAGKDWFRRISRAPFRLGGACIAPVRRAWHNWSEGRAAQSDLWFDYGAAQSVRELVSDGHYQRYFQRLDRDLYLQVIEQRILNCVVDFLDEHDIDTSELSQRTATILNNGVMVTGQGQIRTGEMAVGGGASTGGMMSKVTSKVPGRGAEKGA